MYPGQMYPPSIDPNGAEPTTPGQFDPFPPPSIKHSGTEPYYTRSV